MESKSKNHLWELDNICHMPEYGRLSWRSGTHLFKNSQTRDFSAFRLASAVALLSIDQLNATLLRSLTPSSISATQTTIPTLVNSDDTSFTDMHPGAKITDIRQYTSQEVFGGLDGYGRRQVIRDPPGLIPLLTSLPFFLLCTRSCFIAK
jgi:hypothetical protein